MAFVSADRVQETSTTTGTGTYDLGGALTGFQSFVAGIGTTNTCYYTATNGTDWEVGIGTVTDAATDTLARTTILKSSNSNNAVNWGAGTKTIFCTAPALVLGMLVGNGQIQFPATVNPSTDVNTLDDYEEGSWTPGMTFNASATGVTYSGQNGTYTKVGRMVFARGRVALTSNGTGVGTARITGLPFQAHATTDVPGNGYLYTGGSAATGIFVAPEAGATTLLLIIPGATGATFATDTNCTDTFDFRFFVAYEVD